MRQTFTLLLLVGIFAEGVAQSRIPLVEHFTNTYCIICASRNPTLYQVMDGFEGRMHHITFFPSVPYSQCPLYNYNKEGNGAREAFYAIPATPRVIVDGQSTATSSNAFSAAIEAQLDVPAVVSLEVAEVDDNRTKNTTVTMKGLALTEASDYRLFVALVEKELDFAAENGEREHFNVFREMLTPNEGEPITLPAVGASTTWQYEVTAADELNFGELYILAYVQDMSTGEILNSGSRFTTQTTAVHDQVDDGVTVFPNPVSQYLTVQSDELLGKITAYSMIGQTVAREEGMDYLLQLDMSLLPEGQYVIEYITRAGVVGREKILLRR
ncbi:MAG: Omp28-related outer membrane protein [Saprospiraceae bacterium]|nr:Omp28-related outer membrane protein [Saprospiraceae bacterium]